MASKHVDVTFVFYFILLLCVIQNVSNEKTEAAAKNSGIFKPTKEWQTVRKGQPIPKGLHVRVNFETGITEAKLLDTDDSKSKNTAVLAIPDSEEVINSEGNDEIGLSDQNLRDSLDKISANDDSPAKEPKKVFRSYEELKKDFDDINMLVETDLELINNLMKRFVTSTTDGKISILTDLEYLVHQFDNALEFSRMDGFTEIVYPCFNATSIVMRAEAMRLLGSAVQSNPQVQILALTSGSVQLLLRSLLHDKDVTVRSRALYALSCLVRNFPIAQQKLVAEGGLSVLVQTFDSRDNSKLKVKIVTLINDLLQEKQITEKMVKEALVEESNDSSHDLLHEKLLQYNLFELEPKIVESGWCDRVPQLLVAETAKPDNDVVEKVLNAMQVLIHMCHKEFTRASVRSNLSSLEKWYKQVVQWDPDDYYKDLANLLSNVLTKLQSVKSEL